MTVKAIKGLGKAYEAFKKAGVVGDKATAKDLKEIISKGKDLPYDSKKILLPKGITQINKTILGPFAHTRKMLDEVSGKFKKAGVTGDKAKMGEIKKDFGKIINQKAPTPSKAGSAPTKKSMDFEKDSSGVVTPKPSGKKTETEAYLKKLKIKKDL